MGLDASYQALPDGCELLVRAVRDDEYGAWLGLAPRAIARGGLYLPGPSKPAEVAFDASIRTLIEEHPGIERRNLFTAYRRWDVLHYLLSEGRRRGDSHPHDLGTAAVVGRAHVGDVRAGQGLPIRYTGAADALDIAAWLEHLTPAALRYAYDPPRMERLGVYKFWADRAANDEWSLIEDAFTDLRAFYSVAAEHGEGALVVLD